MLITIKWRTQWVLFRDILIENSNPFIEENMFENVVCKMAAIMSRPQCIELTLQTNLINICNKIQTFSLKEMCFQNAGHFVLVSR